VAQGAEEHWYARLVPREVVPLFSGLTIVPEPPPALGHSTAHGVTHWNATLRPFNVTWTMVERARFMQGNMHRLRDVLRRVVRARVPPFPQEA